MKGNTVIADSGPIFSLAIVDKLDLLDKIFSNVFIAESVWQEITLNKQVSHYNRIVTFFQNKVIAISGFNELVFIMDQGESESVILYKELNADYLLIDDSKAKKIAESLALNCIGTLGLLIVAKQRGLIEEMKPLFEVFLKNKRYYSPIF